MGYRYQPPEETISVGGLAKVKQWEKDVIRVTRAIAHAMLPAFT